MKLENFTPAGNQVLAKVRYYSDTESGLIHKIEPERDMFAEIVAIGPTVEKAKVGQFVMFADVALIHFPFEHEGDEITCVLTNEFQIIGYYKPDKGEDRIFVPQDPEAAKRLPDRKIQVVGEDALGQWADDNNDLLN